MSVPARVVILGGAGAMGRITVADFVRTARGRVRPVVADRVPSRVRGVESVAVDVSDPKSLARGLDGAFATIASLPYRYNLAAMQGALAAGAHYVDLGGLFHVTRRQRVLQRAFERRGLMAILGMGSAPGILNVQAAWAARDLDTVREVHCLVGAADRTRYREEPLLPFGYAPDTLIDEYAMPSAVFRNGRFAMVPALDPGERIEVDFPKPVGRIAVDTTLHSEVATLPLAFADRGIREVTFRQGFDPRFMERLQFLVRLGLADTRALERGRGATNGVVPRDVLHALIGRLPAPKRVGRPWRYEVLRTLVRGRRRGRAVTVTVDCHAGPRSGLGIGPDIDTGAPPSIAVQMMLRGEIPLRPGVWAPEEVVPPAPFFRELERRGMRVVHRTRAGR